MIKTVLDKEIVVTAIPHPSGFNYDVGRYSFESSDGFKMDFAIAPHFYRRSGDSPSITSPEDWDPPNVGRNQGCETYCKLYKYNCKGLPFRYSIKIRGAEMTSPWVTNYDAYNNHVCVNCPYTFDEGDLSAFLDDWHHNGKEVDAHIRIELNYGGMVDGYAFTQDTDVAANYQELEMVENP